MVATIESAAEFRVGIGTPSQRASSAVATRLQEALSRPASTGQSAASRPFVPNDPGYITVEPDGRDDVGFRDRLRQAIEAVVSAFADRESVAEVTDRVFASVSDTLDKAEAAGEEIAVQLRIASLDVSVSDSAGADAFASIRQFALEVGIARDGAVSAEDTQVLATDGRSLGLSQEQVRAGLTTGRYERVDTGSDERLSEAARERLAAARSGLERVKAVQDALSAFRLGDDAPLRELFEGDGGSLGQVFPGIGALSFR
jgi:hypothetical protein